MKNMKKNLLAVLLGASVVLGGVVTSQTMADGHEGEKAKEGEMSLEDHMEVMASGMKKLRSSLKKDSMNATSLEWLEKMQAATVASKSMTPRMGKGMPADALKKMETGYRIKMNEQLILLAQVEIAVLQGKNKEASKAMYKDLKDMKKDGHDVYIKEE